MNKRKTRIRVSYGKGKNYRELIKVLNLNELRVKRQKNEQKNKFVFKND